MRDRKIKNDLLQRGGTYVFASLSGMLASVIIITLCALLMYALGLPLSFSGYFSLMALGGGCLLSGYICGRIKRRSGLKLGLRCGLILFSVIGLAAAASGNVNGSAIAEKLITTVITGCTGGVLGVNREDR